MMGRTEGPGGALTVPGQSYSRASERLLMTLENILPLQPQSGSLSYLAPETTIVIVKIHLPRSIVQGIPAPGPLFMWIRDTGRVNTVEHA